MAKTKSAYAFLNSEGVGRMISKLEEAQSILDDKEQSYYIAVLC